jgi:hypothetical protein
MREKGWEINIVRKQIFLQVQEGSKAEIPGLDHAGLCSSEAVDSYSGDARFESRSSHDRCLPNRIYISPPIRRSIIEVVVSASLK